MSGRHGVNRPRDRYIVKSLVHAAALLEAFRSSADVLRLRASTPASGE